MVQSVHSRKQVPFSVNLRPGEYTIGLHKPFEGGIWGSRVVMYTAARLVNMLDILPFLLAFAVYDY